MMIITLTMMTIYSRQTCSGQEQVDCVCVCGEKMRSSMKGKAIGRRGRQPLFGQQADRSKMTAKKKRENENFHSGLRSNVWQKT